VFMAEITTEGGIVEDFRPLFDPRVVAVIGATNNWNKWGFSTFSSALDGFKGKVYPVNNKREDVLGHESFKNVTDIPDEVDLAIFVIPAPGVPEVMHDCVQKAVKAAVIISAGFAETGEEGRKLQNEVLEIARGGGIRFVGPNCMGFWSASSELRAFMAPLPIKPGPIAFVTQGGNVGGAIVRSAYERGVGFHRYVSCGCTADIQIEDYIEHFGQDPEVKVILAYIEGLSDGKRFIEKVRKVTPKKPVIVLKPGKTEVTAKAIASHSGALCGSDEVYEEGFKKAGAIRVETTEELLDVAIGFLTQPLPRGRNIAIITPGGSYGVLCADYCSSGGLDVITLSKKTIDELDRIFPPRWSHGNPVDPAGDRNFAAYLDAPEMLLKLDEVDALIFMGFGGFSSLLSSMGPTAQSSISKERLRLEERFKSGDIRSILSLVSPIFTAGEDKWRRRFEELFIPVIEFGELDISPEKVNLADLNEVYHILDLLLGGLFLHWIKTYRKPMVTTTFTEMGSFLNLKGGFYYSYPSPQRAARVLIKLAEYKEYLEGIKV
jgi:acetyltransferase